MKNRGKRAIKASLLALAVTAAGLLGSVQSAMADAFTFNPTGGASTPTYTINGLGFGAGNALAVNAIPLTVGSTFQVYFQTHLTSLTGPTAPASVPGLNSSYQITEVATLTEQVASITTGPTGTTANFTLIPGANDRISIYYNPAVVFNDAAGTGFTAGLQIAQLSPSNFTGSSFLDKTAGGGAGTVMFNQTGAGNGLGAQSHVGSGSTGINNGVTSYNPAFFQPPTGNPTLTSSIFNSNLAAPFDAVSPSVLFTNPITSVSFPANIGAVNGQSGPDFQLQVSGFTQSFSAAPVPEPASVTLMGLGVIGALVVVRRQRAKVA